MFGWLKSKYPDIVRYFKKNDNFKESVIAIDNLCIDCNGIFHPVVADVYNLHNTTLHSFLKKKEEPNMSDKKKEAYGKICEKINEIFNLVNPSKRLILCIDGVAGSAKQMQQRKRRFKSVDTMSEKFNTNAISPGTQWMDDLMKYIHDYIKCQLQNDDKWGNIEVIFSDDKVPGEGEHKIISFCKKRTDESYCIHGLDADLIMLGLQTHIKNFYILRDETYDLTFNYQLVTLDTLRDHLISDMHWNGKYGFVSTFAINDFIMICFFVGNDFIPMSPSFDIIEGGMDIILNEYKNVCAKYGHLTIIKRDMVVQIVFSNFKKYIEVICKYEKVLLEKKLNTGDKYYFDELLYAHSSRDENNLLKITDFEHYRKLYYKSKMGLEDTTTLCKEYLHGVCWVLAYYSKGMPDWDWNYTFHYSPFACDLLKVIDTMEQPVFYKRTSKPPPIFVQLLSILPPQSADLLPPYYAKLLQDEDSKLAEFSPYSFKIDKDNKLKDWEGIVLIPFVDKDVLFKCYLEGAHTLTKYEINRNKFHSSLLMTKGTTRFINM